MIGACNKHKKIDLTCNLTWNLWSFYFQLFVWLYCHTKRTRNSLLPRLVFSPPGLVFLIGPVSERWANVHLMRARGRSAPLSKRARGSSSSNSWTAAQFQSPPPLPRHWLVTATQPSASIRNVHIYGLYIQIFGGTCCFLIYSQEEFYRNCSSHW